MRGSLTSTVAVALLLSFAKAPFDHIHRHDAEHGHATGLSHVHASQLFPGSPAMQAADEDEDVQPLEWIVLGNDGAGPLVGIASEATTLPAPEQQSGLLRMPVPCAHDPPFSPSCSSRAPPA